MAALDETGTRAEVLRVREQARAARAERAAAAASAWQASGRPPAMKGSAAADYGDDVLTHVQVRALLDACGTSTTGRRNAAMIALLYGSAIRIGEACGLYPADLDLGAVDPDSAGLAGTVFIRARKGGKHDSVGIGLGLLPYLVAWTERRASLGVNGRDPYFCAISGDSLGNPTSPSYWRHALKRLAAQAGIEGKHVHPHGLRRTAATHMHHHGVPLDVVQRQLGHASLATTEVYLGTRVYGDHMRLMGAHGADVTRDTGTAEVALDTGTGVVVSVAEATAAAGVAYAQLPADVRQSMSREQVAGFIAGTVSAWQATAARP